MKTRDVAIYAGIGLVAFMLLSRRNGTASPISIALPSGNGVIGSARGIAESGLGVAQNLGEALVGVSDIAESASGAVSDVLGAVADGAEVVGNVVETATEGLGIITDTASEITGTAQSTMETVRESTSDALNLIYNIPDAVTKWDFGVLNDVRENLATISDHTKEVISGQDFESWLEKQKEIYPGIGT
jgi:hypothetical protein